MPTYRKGKKFITKFMVDGVRHSRMTDTEAKGEAWELQARAALKLGQPLPDAEVRRIGGTDAGTLGNLFRETEVQHWSRQKDSSKTILNASIFVQWVGPNASVQHAFSQETTNKFIEYLLTERKVAPATVNRYKSAIGVMAKRVKRQLDELPEMPKFKESRGRFRFFSEPEEAAITGLWRLWSRLVEVDFFIFLVETGARTYTEGVALNWDAVHKDRVIFWDTKNGGFRSVPLTTRARQALIRQQHNGLAGPFSGLSKRWLRTLWNNTRAQLPQVADAVLYCTRHTFGSRAIMRGIPLTVVQKLMGHATIEMTQRYAIFEDGAAFEIALAALNRPMPSQRFDVIEGGAVDTPKDAGSFGTG